MYTTTVEEIPAKEFLEQHCPAYADLMFELRCFNIVLTPEQEKVMIETFYTERLELGEFQSKSGDILFIVSFNKEVDEVVFTDAKPVEDTAQ